MSRGRYTVDASSTVYTKSTYGLLSTAVPLPVAGDHWQTGVVWNPVCPDASATLDPCNAVEGDGTGGVTPIDSGAVAAKSETAQYSIVGATPFTVLTEVDCSPVAHWDDLPSTVSEALDQAEERAVEHAFWTGAVPGYSGETVYPHLADDGTTVDDGVLLQQAATVVTSVPQPLSVAVGMLEHAAGDCVPGLATLHIPLRLASLLARDDILTTRGGKAFTASGSPLVLGAGYTGSAPDGTTTPGTTWIYATGPVFAIGGTKRSFSREDSIDLRTNTVRIIVERTYIIGYSCCLLAIPVDNEEALS